MKIRFIQSYKGIKAISNENVFQRKSFVVLFLLVMLSTLFTNKAQQTTTTGNLLRINFTKPAIDFSDTLWQWTDTEYKDGYLRFGCTNVVKTNSALYLLIYGDDENPHYPANYLYLYNCVTKSKRQLIYDHPGFDAMEPYLYYKPIVEYTSEGAIIFNGIRNAAFFLKNDSLSTLENINGLSLIHIAGKIGNKSLVVAERSQRYDFSFYLEDLSFPGQISLSKPVTFEDPNRVGQWRLSKIFSVSDSLYLYVEDYTQFVGLFYFSNNQIKLTKRLRPPMSNTVTIPMLTTYRYFNKCIYYVEKGDLFKESYDSSTKDFIRKTIVIPKLGNSYSFSNNNSLVAHIRNDSLIVFSLMQEKELGRFDIATFRHQYYPVIDSPYVYVHQIKTVTGITNSEKLPEVLNLEQNYPNPFNPTTTIKYSIPPVGRNSVSTSKVVLKIYDLLGKEVAALVDAEMAPGVYEVKFDGTGFASGIYIYRLVNGSSAISRKFVLLK